MDPGQLKTVLNVPPTAAGRISPLYRWMVRYYRELAQEFETNGPMWKDRVVAMEKAGLTDRLGKPPTIRTAQETWYRVVADVKTGKAKPSKSEPAIEPHAPKPSPVVSAQRAVATSPLKLPRLDEPTEDDDEFVLRSVDGTPIRSKKD